MRIIALGALRDFWIKHPDALEPLSAWYPIGALHRLARPCGRSA